MLNEEQIIKQTKNWIKSVVIECNFCPFASKPFHNKTIRYKVQNNLSKQNYKEIISHEFRYLDENPETETSFLILPENFNDFNVYLSLVGQLDKLIKKENYSGVYQIASFHPDYLFQDSDDNDPANFTNRSIYPMLHFIREESLEKAIAFHPNPDQIPQDNVNFCREKGLNYMQVLRNTCL
jgi:hypothetical protein